MVTCGDAPVGALDGQQQAVFRSVATGRVLGAICADHLPGDLERYLAGQHRDLDARTRRRLADDLAVDRFDRCRPGQGSGRLAGASTGIAGRRVGRHLQPPLSQYFGQQPVGADHRGHRPGGPQRWLDPDLAGGGDFPDRHRLGSAATDPAVAGAAVGRARATGAGGGAQWHGPQSFARARTGDRRPAGGRAGNGGGIFRQRVRLPDRDRGVHLVEGRRDAGGGRHPRTNSRSDACGYALRPPCADTAPRAGAPGLVCVRGERLLDLAAGAGTTRVGR